MADAAFRYLSEDELKYRKDRETELQDQLVTADQVLEDFKLTYWPIWTSENLLEAARRGTSPNFYVFHALNLY